MKIPAILLVETCHKPGSLGGKIPMQPTPRIVFAADGRGINKVAAFPGLFTGVSEAAAPRFTDGMLDAAAHALAKRAGAEELRPGPLSLEAHRSVTVAVRLAATEPASTAVL